MLLELLLKCIKYYFMIRPIFSLVFLGVYSLTSALEITSQSIKKPPQRAGQNIFWEIDPQSYIDFWKSVQVVKKHHFIEIYPDFYEWLFVQIPEKTPEYLFFEKIVGVDKMPSLVSFGYFFNREKHKIPPIRLFENRIKEAFAKRNPDVWFATNTQNTVYYQVNSPKEQTIAVKVFPATDKDHILFYNWEYETFGFEHPERVIFTRPELKTNQERNEHVQKEYQFPTISMLDSTMDIYDVQLQTSQDNFQTSQTDWTRKMVWTHFGKDFAPPMEAEYNDGKIYTIMKDLFTFLPYYETKITIPKWYTTIVISYKNLQMTDGSLTVPLMVEK